MPGDQRDPVRDMEMFAVFRQDGLAPGRTDGHAACGLGVSSEPSPMPSLFWAQRGGVSRRRGPIPTQ